MYKINGKFFIALVFLYLVFFFKRQCLNLPAFGDEINYIHGTLTIIKHHLDPFVYYWDYKPPVFLMIAASMCKIFGYSLIILRIPILLFSFLMLYFTFLIGKKIYNERTGFLASLLLFFSPQFFSQSGLFYSDILVGALTLSTIYFFLENDMLKYLIFAGLLVLTKELAVLTVISIAIYKFLIGWQEHNDPSQAFLYKLGILVRRSLLLLSPLLFFIVWMLLNKLFLGWFLWPHWSHLVQKFSIDLGLYHFIFMSALWVNFKFLVTLVILVSLLLSLISNNGIRQQLFKKELLLFFIISVTGIIGLGGLSHNTFYGYTPRYLLYIQPLFFLTGSACIVQLVKDRTVSALIFGVIMLLFIFSWKSTDGYWYDLNMDYLDIIQTHEQTIKFLEKNFPSNIIVANMPIKNELTDKAYGYVHDPLNYVITNVPLALNNKNIGQAPVIVVSSKYFDPWTPEGQQLSSFLRLKDKKLLARFTAGDKDEVSIYSLNIGPDR